jgi:hypothetical protein
MNILYEGRVYIKSGNYKYSSKNSGTSYLFDLISRIFSSSEMYSHDELPGAMMLYNLEKSGITNPTVAGCKNYELLNYIEDITSHRESSYDGAGVPSYKIVYTALLTNSKIKANYSINSSGNITLALIGSDHTNILATYEIPNANTFLLNLNTSGTAVVRWEMIFSNPDGIPS